VVRFETDGADFLYQSPHWPVTQRFLYVSALMQCVSALTGWLTDSGSVGPLKGTIFTL